MKKALRQRFKQLIESHGLGANDLGRHLLLYLIAQAVSPVPTNIPLLLRQIKINFHCDSLYALCQFLAEFPVQHDNLIGDCFLAVCTSPTEIEKCFDALLQFSRHDNANNLLLNRIIMALHRHPAEHFKKIVIVKLRQLMNLPKNDQQKDKIIKFCHKLGEWPLNKFLSPNEICWLIQLHLPLEDEKTYLRGTTFTSKLIGQLVSQFKPALLSLLKPFLDNAASIIISAANNNESLMAAENPALYEKIARSNQLLINYICSDNFINSFPNEIKVICKLMRTDLMSIRKFPKESLPSYIAGFIFLRFVNPTITEYGISDEFNKMLGEQISAETRACCREQISVVSPKLIQGIANKTPKDDEGKLAPVQYEMMKNEANRQAMTDFLYEISASSFLTVDLNDEGSSLKILDVIPSMNQPILKYRHPLLADTKLYESVIKLLLRAWYDACIAKSLTITQGKKCQLTPYVVSRETADLPVLSLFFKPAALIRGEDVAKMIDALDRVIVAYESKYSFIKHCMDENLDELKQQLKIAIATRAVKIEKLRQVLRNNLEDYQHDLTKLDTVTGTAYKLQIQPDADNDRAIQQAMTKSIEQSDSIVKDIKLRVLQTHARNDELSQLLAQQENNSIILKALRLRILLQELQHLAAQCYIFEAYEESKQPATLTHIKISALSLK